MQYFFILLSFILIACSSDELPSPLVDSKINDTKQKELELAFEKQSIENKELIKTLSLLETQKKNAEELTEKIKIELSKSQQKLEDIKSKSQNQNDNSKNFESEKEKLLGTIKDKEEIISNLKKNLAEQETKIANFKPTDTSSFTKEIKEKNELIKSLTEEKDALKSEMRTLNDKLKAINKVPEQ